MKTIWFQVRHATLANYSAVIVYNVGSNKLVPMAGSDDALIPSVFLGGDDAQAIQRHQVYWSVTQLYSLDFSQSGIGVKKCVFNKRTIKVCVS